VHLSVRILGCVAAQARKKNPRSMPDGACKKLTGSRHTGQNGRPPASTSTKPLTQDLNLGDYYSDIGKTRLSLILLHYGLHSDSQTTRKESSSSIDPQTSPSNILSPPPPGWLPKMNEFILDHVSKGEELKSIRILLETEWPELVDRVDLVWLKDIGSKGIGPNLSHRR